jgi:hypothetical protein
MGGRSVCLGAVLKDFILGPEKKKKNKRNVSSYSSRGSKSKTKALVRSSVL